MKVTNKASTQVPFINCKHWGSEVLLLYPGGPQCCPRPHSQPPPWSPFSAHPTSFDQFYYLRLHQSSKTPNLSHLWPSGHQHKGQLHSQWFDFSPLLPCWSPSNRRCSRARRAKPSLKPFSSLSSPPTQMLLPPEPGLDYTISLASSPDTPAISNPPLSSTFFQ